MNASHALSLAASWPVGTAAVGVVGPDGVLATSGPAGHAMPWASVTKLLTALAALVAVEEGVIALDEPAGPQGSTIRHLLAHASGLPLDGDEIAAAPATKRIYSNLGIETVAARIAQAAEMPFRRYLTEAVLVPVAMTGTRLGGSPAWGALGPLQDLLALASELLAPSIISPETLDLATSVAFSGLSGVLPGFGMQRPNDWGLGFELRDHKARHWTGKANSPRTFGHFGQTGSFLWVDPDARLACACLADRDFGSWAIEAWPALSDAVIEEFGPARNGGRAAAGPA